MTARPGNPARRHGLPAQYADRGSLRPVPPQPPPTVVRVIADHGDTVLWNRSPACPLGAANSTPRSSSSRPGLPTPCTRNQQYAAHDTSKWWLNHGGVLDIPFRATSTARTRR